jgi:hypothetical protein
MVSFNRGDVVKYKGRAYVYFAASMFIKNKHMLATLDPKTNKVVTTRVKTGEFTMHENKDAINQHDVEFILYPEHEVLARNF